MSSLYDIRAAFLDFFKKNGHEVVPSSPLVPQNDPTLMFTNAGMNQFKNVFTGAEKRSYVRAATSQKCVRAGGKHNDLDNVGYTARHHTFFEMLGNFSFGDYFKEEAINLAWELLTKGYGLNPDKLCVTVYHDDDVAWNHWKKITGFADHRIIRIATNDNFWSMGDTGPCGPCSEIFYDHGESIPGGPPGSPDADGDRFVEIWNLVFMQYEQLEGGKRVNLPKPCVDTGMGLERVSAVMQGVHDNYEIDLFRRLIDAIEKESRVENRESSRKLSVHDSSHSTLNTARTAHRVIADHLRSSCFLMADGVMPSNEGRGYVLRRIMRRAMRYAHQLGCNEPLMYRLVPALVSEMGRQYPELSRAQPTIADNLRQEEERFKETLERGLKLLEEETANLSKDQQLPGDAAFKLYDTYGFPLDLTQDILKGRGIGVDTDGFERCMENQREMARAAYKGSGDSATGKIWFEIKEKIGKVQFLGYEQDEADSIVLAMVKDGAAVAEAGAGDEVYIVLNQTPFYGESGGQVGDTGVLATAGCQLATIIDTQKPLDDFIVHKAKLSAPLNVGDKVHATIDAARRTQTRANHSATHLLHKALRDALGQHVTQKGSLVAPDRLRFDFSHSKAVTKEELAAIEQKVNEIVSRDTPVECREMAPDEAIKAGAMALFGEKYGEKVRVLSIGDSVELCGGTHVRRTGDIGLFKIISEGSVASGIRRIEAVTGENVRTYFMEELNKQNAQLKKLQLENQKLNDEFDAVSPPAGGRLRGGHVGLDFSSNAPLPASPLQGEEYHTLPAIYEKKSGELQRAILALTESNKQLAKQLTDIKKQAALGNIGDVKPEIIGGVNFIGEAFQGLDPKELRSVAEMFLKQADIAAVATNVDSKASIVVGVNKPLSEKFSAVTLVQAAVAAVGGKGGGGRPEMAQGGGPEGGKLEAALAAVRATLA